MLSEGMWRCKDGRLIPISFMSDQHLDNTIKLLERKGLTEIPDLDTVFSVGAYAWSGDTPDGAAMAAEQEFQYMLNNPPMIPNPKYEELLREQKARMNSFKKVDR